MKLFANLHTHSTHSDGVYTPRELARVAKGEGYKAIALTDHDVASGFPELRDECEALGLEYLLGCEFSGPWKELGVDLHIVGFDFNAEYAPMKEYLEQRSFCETYQTKVLFERGLAEGLISGISWDEVLEFNPTNTWLCNEHVFRAMKAKNLATDTDYPDFFAKVYGKRRAEVKLPYPFKNPKELIELIHGAGGIAIFAHPGKNYGGVELIPELVRLGIDGAEVWHRLLTPDEKTKVLQAALKYNLYVSGGSDHDGLCGGQYQRYTDPTTSEFFTPELSTGTTEYFYNEIKNKRKAPDRAEVIKELIKSC